MTLKLRQKTPANFPRNKLHCKAPKEHLDGEEGESERKVYGEDEFTKIAVLITI